MSINARLTLIQDESTVIIPLIVQILALALCRGCAHHARFVLDRGGNRHRVNKQEINLLCVHKVNFPTLGEGVSGLHHVSRDFHNPHTVKLGNIAVNILDTVSDLNKAGHARSLFQQFIRSGGHVSNHPIPVNPLIRHVLNALIPFAKDRRSIKADSRSAAVSTRKACKLSRKESVHFHLCSMRFATPHPNKKHPFGCLCSALCHHRDQTISSPFFKGSPISGRLSLLPSGIVVEPS